mmetsp:Transcript_1640/g.4872  ORF Transcript_1640/g.4872 Transcript_1640/m.4872 type:complete len:148 (+) Transcript_1640:61-504(+)
MSNVLAHKIWGPVETSNSESSGGNRQQKYIDFGLVFEEFSSTTHSSTNISPEAQEPASSAPSAQEAPAQESDTDKRKGKKKGNVPRPGRNQRMKCKQMLGMVEALDASAQPAAVEELKSLSPYMKVICDAKMKNSKAEKQDETVIAI